MDIDSLVAGPELDALVAEKVMGMVWYRDWPLNSEGAAINAGIPFLSYPGRDIRLATDEDLKEKKDLNGIEEYSTDIAAAWEVVEKLNLMVMPVESASGKRWGWAAEQITVEKADLKKGSGYYLEVGTELWTHAETAPLAICRAALKAVGA